MTQPLDFEAHKNGTRPITYKDGRKFTLYCCDAPGDCPVHGRVEGFIIPLAFTLDGRLGVYSVTPYLIQAPAPKRKIKVWLAVLRDGDVTMHVTRECAERKWGAQTKEVFGPIEIEEGQGL